jgi:hypothetical protein
VELPQDEAIDVTCDGRDGDCDGSIDEDYTPVPTTCGVGECAGNTGAEECQNGMILDTCDPLAGAMPEGPPGDQTCSDILDNDCDGDTDGGDQDCVCIPTAEVWYDGIDQNCDGWNDYDQDMDTYVDSAWNNKAGGTSPNTDDCDDINPDLNPGGPPVRVFMPHDGWNYYQTIQEAYGAPFGLVIVQSKADTLTEDLNFDSDKFVQIESGYNCGYTAITGRTTIDGNMTVNDGSVTIQSGTLAVQ